MPLLVSILIPAFNAQDSIADTIKSALGQTWPEKEIIIVDDGSSDRTISIAQRFLCKDLTVVRQQNQGAAAARNKAYSLSRGDYIQWLDADDLLAPDKIEKQIQALEPRRSPRALLSSAWGYFICRVSKAHFSPSPLWYDLSPLEWLVRKWENNAHMQTATWLVSRELTEAAGPWDRRLLGDDDGEYFCRVVRASDGIRFIREARVFYRRSDSRRLSYIGNSDKKMEAQFLGMQMQIEYLRSMEDSERVRAACVNYLQTWLIHFYPNKPDIVEQAQRLAKALGGRLERPRLSWKYDWIRKVFGWNAAKRTQLFYNRCKASIMRSWDKAWFRCDELSPNF